MMSGFTKGVLFTISMAMFGKGMYGLGRLDERKEQAKDWKTILVKLYEIEDILDKSEDKKEEEA